MPTLTPRVRDESVILDPEESIIEFHRFKRNIRAVGKRAIDPVAAVTMGAAAIATAEYFKVDIVSTVPELA